MMGEECLSMRCASSSERKSAIDDEFMAGDEIGIFRCQHERAACDVEGLAEPAEGRLLLPYRTDLRLVEIGLRHAAVDGAGADIVGGDVELAELERQRAREASNAGLGGRIGRESEIGVEGHHR